MTAHRIDRALAALLIAGLTIAATALAGEAAAPNPGRQPSPPGAAVGFEGLADGAVVPPTFTVRFRVDGMEVAPAGTAVPNSGHHHLLIDLTEFPDPDLPLPATDRIRHFGGGQTQVELTLPAGEHTLQLLFADSRHIPHDPVVKSERITITVDAGAAPE